MDELLIDGKFLNIDLPEASLQCLLKIFNSIWETGEFPPSWRAATIIPIAKIGKTPNVQTISALKH